MKKLAWSPNGQFFASIESVYSNKRLKSYIKIWKIIAETRRLDAPIQEISEENIKFETLTWLDNQKILVRGKHGENIEQGIWDIESGLRTQYNLSEENTPEEYDISSNTQPYINRNGGKEMSNLIINDIESSLALKYPYISTVLWLDNQKVIVATRKQLEYSSHNNSHIQFFDISSEVETDNIRANFIIQRMAISHDNHYLAVGGKRMTDDRNDGAFSCYDLDSKDIVLNKRSYSPCGDFSWHPSRNDIFLYFDGAQIIRVPNNTN